MKKLAIIVLCLIMLLPLAGCTEEEPQNNAAIEKPAAPKNGVYVVGEHIPFDSVTDFYYTISATTFPPHYQRYRFFVEDGEYKFFHETREGDHLPLTESDATVSETIPLNKEQWQAFLDCVAGGTVIARQEHLESGDSGPWLYLYWTGDPGDVQEFEFASVNARFSFEALCEELRDA